MMSPKVKFLIQYFNQTAVNSHTKMGNKTEIKLIFPFFLMWQSH